MAPLPTPKTEEVPQSPLLFNVLGFDQVHARGEEVFGCQEVWPNCQPLNHQLKKQEWIPLPNTQLVEKTLCTQIAGVTSALHSLTSTRGPARRRGQQKVVRRRRQCNQRGPSSGQMDGMGWKVEHSTKTARTAFGFSLHTFRLCWKKQRKMAPACDR